MATNPSPATLQSEFEQAVAYALHLWQDLSLAVQENWGGPDSSDKRDWLAGAVVELFPDISKLSPSALLQQLQQQNQQSQQQQNDNSSSSTEEPDEAYIEEFLLNVMLDEFEVAIDNESAALVAEQIVRARTECLRGKIDGEVADLRRRFSSKRPNEKVNFKLVEQDQEADWDTEDGDDDDDDDDENEEMTDAVPELVKKEKKEPEVDEDGFTKVVSRKKK
ncbi:Pre-rRNA-processing protein TSR2 domain containing protein [Rhypophila decipiens]